MSDWNDDNDYWEYKQFQKNYKNQPAPRGISHPVLNIVLVVIGIILCCVSVGLGLIYFGLYLSALFSGMI